MSDAVSSYVRRHRLVLVSKPKGLILMVLANVADEAGRAKMTQPMIATDLGCALSTVELHMSALLRERYIVKSVGRIYVIIGAAEHDVQDCDHVECLAEAESIRRGAVSDKKKRQAAERARRAREKRKRESATQA